MALSLIRGGGIARTDSYKSGHWLGYPPNTEEVYSYAESRGSDFPIVFFGLQYFLKEYLVGQQVTSDDVEYMADRVAAVHGGNGLVYNRAGLERIVSKHGGRWPVSIKAVPEGTVIGPSNVLFSVVNTDPTMPWVTNYIETLLSNVWYPTSVASQSRSQKADIVRFARMTGADPYSDYRLHDFGARGVSCPEEAALGGAAHLVNFSGSDNYLGMELAIAYYGADNPGHSIPAAEHSTITSWGRAYEGDAFRNMLQQFPTGMVAVVSDSYNIYDACRDLWGGSLKDAVRSRNGTVVVRPDSGEPAKVVVEVLGILGDAFGFTVNGAGYRVLPPQIRVIQGDGINRRSIVGIMQAVADARWSLDNIAFGSGGGLLRDVNRDTIQFAIKCSEITVNGERRGVSKHPIGMPSKNSKEGRLGLIASGNAFKTVSESKADALGNHLVEVFRDGELLREWSFGEVRLAAAL